MNLFRYKISKIIIILSGLLYLINPIICHGFDINNNRAKSKRIRNEHLERKREAYKNNRIMRKRKKDAEIIFRGNILFGLGTSNNEQSEATTTATMFSVANIGFGNTVTILDSQKTINQETYEFSTNDLYWVFGRSNTFALGYSKLVKGNLKIKINENVYESNKFSGSGYSFIFGSNVGIFEILAGYKYISFKIEEVKFNENKIDDKKNSLSQTIIGIGIKY